MKMIGNVLDKQDSSGPHGSNNLRHSDPKETIALLNEPQEENADRQFKTQKNMEIGQLEEEKSRVEDDDEEVVNDEE